MKRISLLWVLVLFLLGISLGTLGNNYFIKHLKKDPYPHRIGYIYHGTELDSINRHAHKPLHGFYSSSAPEIYKKSKYQFKERLLKAYKAENHTDNGYFNLRFYISNEGKVWIYKVNQLTHDLEPTQFTEGLVNELIYLSLKEDNWDSFKEEDLNYYMYLTYRLEDGKITEILP